jgi:hypothetical protein
LDVSHGLEIWERWEFTPARGGGDVLRGRVKGKDKAESQTPYYVYAEANAVEALIIKW